MLHKDFVKLSRSEKLKYYLYEEMENKREKYFTDKETAKMNMNKGSA